ncbi:MAG: hypothetical protein ABIQ44_00135 [Chloroflexia bacterium]
MKLKEFSKMQVIHSFPEKLKHVNEQVEEIRLYYPLSKEDFTSEDIAIYEKLTEEGSRLDYDYYDFFVTLKDGRCADFSAYTPECIREAMDSEHYLSFVTGGLVLVSKISIENILDALENCLEKAVTYGLEHFGYVHPCSYPAEE